MFIEVHSFKNGNRMLLNVDKIVGIFEHNSDGRVGSSIYTDEDHWLLAEKYDDIKRQLIEAVGVTE